MGPLGLNFFARYFLRAAISTQLPEKGPPFARTFLACRALELALKAFLSLKGSTLVELAGGQYGHDLQNLIEEAEKRDLRACVQLTNEQRTEIIKASEYYSEKVLEYPSLTEALSRYSKMPNPDILIGAAEALVEQLQEPCLNAK
jgi:hypothetical protein